MKRILLTLALLACTTGAQAGWQDKATSAVRTAPVPAINAPAFEDTAAASLKTCTASTCAVDRKALEAVVQDAKDRDDYEQSLIDDHNNGW